MGSAEDAREGEAGLIGWLSSNLLGAHQKPRKICTPSELIYQAFELIYTPSSEVLLVGELMS